MPLRDPASISPAIFPANTEGLSLMKTFGADLAKMKNAQGKTKDAMLKLFGNKYNGGWDADTAKRIQPKVDALREEYQNDAVKYRDNIPLDIEIGYQNKMNDIAVEAAESKQQQAEWNKMNAQLLSDEGKDKQFDHDKSELNLAAFRDTEGALEHYKDNSNLDKEQYKKIKQAWDDSGHDQYQYRRNNPIELTAAEPTDDFGKFTSQIKLQPSVFKTSQPDGSFILDTQNKGNRQLAMVDATTQATNLYDSLPEKQKKAVEKTFENAPDKGIYDNARDWRIAKSAESAVSKLAQGIEKTLRNIPPTPSQKRSENTLILPPSKPEQTTYVKDDGSTDTLPTEGGNAFGDAPTNKSFSGAIEYGNGSFKEDEGQAVKGDLTKIGIIDFGGKLGKQPVAFIAKDGKRNDIVYVPLKGSAIDDVIEYMNDKNILLDNSDDDMYKQYLGYSINGKLKKQGDSGSEQQTKTTGTVR